MKYYLLRPKYVNEFKCIASKCEDNCCNVNWIIYIDKKTYEKLINVEDIKVRSLAKKYMKPIKEYNNDGEYAIITKKENGKCAFYEDGICFIHKNLGEDFLGNVCSNYPRVISVVENNVEMSLRLSCPEVARKVLLNPEKMEFQQDLLTKPIKVINKLLDKSKNPKYFWNLREFSIDVLQNREFSIEERLIILGFLYSKIRDNSKETIKKVPYFISQCNIMIKNGIIKDKFKNMSSNYNTKLDFLNPLLEVRVKLSTLNCNFFDECMDEFRIGIKRHSYEEILDKYYEPFMKKHEYMMENLLVNYVYSQLFPYGTENSMYYEYIYMVMNFVLIKYYLFGIASFNQGLKEENIIKLVYSYFKKFESGNESLKMLIELYEMESKIKVDDLFILIND